MYPRFRLLTAKDAKIAMELNMMKITGPRNTLKSAKMVKPDDRKTLGLALITKHHRTLDLTYLMQLLRFMFSRSLACFADNKKAKSSPSQTRLCDLCVLCPSTSLRLFDG